MSSVAQPTPQNSSSSFSPSPPVPLPLDTLARENSPRGESTATEQRAIEDRPCPEPSKPPNPQEDLQEAGGVPSIPGNSPAFPEVIDPFGLAATAENADAEKVEIPGFDAYKRGGALPVVGATPTPTESTTSVEPAGGAEKAVTAKPEASVPWAQDKAGRGREVETPPREGEGALDVLLQGEASREGETPSRKGASAQRTEALPPEGGANAVRHREAWPSAKSRGGREKASTKPPSHHLRRCRRGASATQRRCHTSANSNAPRRHHKGAGANPRRYRQTVSANAARRRKAIRTRPNVSLISRHESRRTKLSCPLGRDQALGIQKGDCQGGTSSIRKGLLRPWSSQRASSPTRKTLAAQCQVSQPAQPHAANHAPITHPSLSHHAVAESTRFFRFEAHREGAASFWVMQRQRRCNMASQRRHLVAVTLS
jgi:hypothetical protein